MKTLISVLAALALTVACAAPPETEEPSPEADVPVEEFVVEETEVVTDSMEVEAEVPEEAEEENGD
jgi:uncharacterized lipoprotein YajG